MGNAKSPEDLVETRGGREKSTNARLSGRWRRLNVTIGKWPLWKTLDYLQKLGILAGLLLFLINVRINDLRKRDERVQKHLQAWQTINLDRTGDWSGGADGRVEALESLVADRVSLDGVDLSHAWLVGANLGRASLRSASLDMAVVDLVDLRGADVAGASSSVRSAVGLNIFGVKNVSADDLRRLRGLGAVEIGTDMRWNACRDSVPSERAVWTRP